MNVLNSKGGMLFAGVLAAGLVIYLLSRKAAGAVGDAAAAVGEAVNPVDPDNLVNRGVTAVGETLSGSAPGSWSLGSWLYDLTHPEYDPNAPPATFETEEDRLLRMQQTEVIR